MTERPGHGGRGRGGQRGHEPAAQIAAREVRVLEHSVQGLSQREIARTEGISQGAVSKILHRLETRALAELVDRVERHKARQSLRLDLLYRESLQAWRASQADATRRVQRKTQPGTGSTGATVAKPCEPARLAQAVDAAIEHYRFVVAEHTLMARLLAGCDTEQQKASFEEYHAMRWPK